MDDIDSALQSFAQYRQRLAETGSANKQTVFDALSDAGITHVCVTFDGEGDSGQIDNIAAYKGDEPAPLPDGKLLLQSVSWGASEVRVDARSIADGIEALCYDFLELQYGGWENNDGAFGEFTLNVAGRTVDLEFNARFSDVHTTTHTF